MENLNENPNCIGCKSNQFIELETETLSTKHYHCNYCGTKTMKSTTFGKIRPVLGLGLLAIFGIKIY
ncbi:MAG: hypothetical protein U0X91_04375 [Spirosomataceae bacterium]